MDSCNAFLQERKCLKMFQRKKMQIILRFVRVGILLLIAGAMAQAQDLQKIQSFSADFEQKVYPSENQGEALKYTGILKALAPSSVLWIYQKPIVKEVYIDAGMMVVFEPKLQQAIITQLQESMDLLAVLREAKPIEKNHYEARVLGQTYTLLLEDGILKEINFMDSLGNKVQIVFSKIVINAEINKEIFEFNPKSDVDIIYH